MDALAQVRIEMSFAVPDVPGAILVFHDEYSRAFRNAIKILREIIRRRCSIGATHALHASIQYEVEDLTSFDAYSYPIGRPAFRGIVYSRPGKTFFYPTGCGYAAAVEHGMKPHWPPFINIVNWVTAVLPGEPWLGMELGMERMKSLGVAWRICKKISLVGTEGQFMFRDGYGEFRQAGILEKLLGDAEARAEAKIAKPENLPWWAIETLSSSETAK